MRIQESAENYLETILILQQQNGQVRSVDIAAHLNFSKPSVSVAMKHFRENGYITIEDGGNIVLTESGREIAERTLERHKLIKGVLIALGVSEETAREDACRIEHVISEESFEHIRHFFHKMTPENQEDTSNS